MFTGNQQHASKPFRMQMPRLRSHLPHLQSDPHDRVFAGKTAIRTGVDTLIGQVERGKHPDRPPEIAPGLKGRLACKFLKLGPIQRRKQRGKPPERG